MLAHDSFLVKQINDTCAWERKDGAKETCGRCLALGSHHAVVASVASVMADHGPTNTNGCRDEDGGNRIPWQLADAGPGSQMMQKHVSKSRTHREKISFEICMAETGTSTTRFEVIHAHVAGKLTLQGRPRT
jgi:hypothetical protein